MVVHKKGFERSHFCLLFRRHQISRLKTIKFEEDEANWSNIEIIFFNGQWPSKIISQTMWIWILHIFATCQPAINPQFSYSLTVSESVKSVSLINLLSTSQLPLSKKEEQHNSSSCYCRITIFDSKASSSKPTTQINCFCQSSFILTS